MWDHKCVWFSAATCVIICYTVIETNILPYREDLQVTNNWFWLKLDWFLFLKQTLLEQNLVCQKAEGKAKWLGLGVTDTRATVKIPFRNLGSALWNNLSTASYSSHSAHESVDIHDSQNGLTFITHPFLDDRKLWTWQAPKATWNESASSLKRKLVLSVKEEEKNLG